MLESLFDSSGYYEYPSFEVAVFSLLLSFVLSSTIAITYKLTYKGVNFPNHLFQAIILSSIVTSMIMMAVGNNFAVGFGIIGAVAIIRFRTLISDPRNIIFMFAGISVGIGTGVYGYSIAIAGTVVFSLVAFLLSFSSYGRFPQPDYEITLDINPENGSKEAEALLNDYCRSVDVVMQRNTETSIRKRYQVKLNNDVSSDILYEKLSSIQSVTNVRIDKNEVRIRL